MLTELWIAIEAVSLFAPDSSALPSIERCEDRRYLFFKAAVPLLDRVSISLMPLPLLKPDKALRIALGDSCCKRGFGT